MTLFEEAICFAVHAHQGMIRRREGAPYILHPMEVASICATMTNDPEVLAAAVLHDTVEDTDTTMVQLTETFGARVAALVATETENKRPELPEAETWFARKSETLETLAAATDPAVKMLWISDKLSNVRAFYRTWRTDPDTLWDGFNQKDPSWQAWYYRSIARFTKAELEQTEAWQEYNRKVEEMFEGVEEAWIK